MAVTDAFGLIIWLTFHRNATRAPQVSRGEIKGYSVRVIVRRFRSEVHFLGSNLYME